ncbi:MAG: hypothetical protein M0002_04945 [Rhodospirillales bacterium]|nr:hypothetical protein [Rhodospirillales bacterium]
MQARIALCVAGGVALLLRTAAARPADQPPLVPARDAAIVYHVQEPDGMVVVHMYFDAAGQRVRIVSSDQPGFSLIDHRAGRYVVVDPAAHSYLRMPVPAGVGNLLFRNPDVRFTRKGTETVAGVSCTDWSWSGGNGGRRDACITADGLVLSSHPAHPRKPGIGLVAVSVTYGPQPSALFEPPPAYHRFQ